MTLPDLFVHNTMTGERERLAPVREGHVGLYVCGVTVYDLAHIGHARVYITFDVITRYLRHRGYDVTYVRNHTDVDDKIIRRATERGVDPLVLAAEYIVALDEDLARLGCLPPSHEPKVSTHIDEIVDLTRTLIERGHAYEVDGDVYFEVHTFPAYGKLSGWKVDETRAGERVAVDERKRNPADFALWKSAKPGEVSWPSPWGPGRPGWHIECSAMSHRYLGANFDIHGGGKDLTFPHHENEIAQSECAHGTHYANLWMHVGLVNINGEKMSKSLGNFWTIRDVLDLYHPEIVRWFMLSAHYRKPVAYSQVNLDLARHRLTYLHRTREALRDALGRVTPLPVADASSTDAWRAQVHAAMDDDFNTPVVLAVLGEAARTANELLTTKKLAKRADVLARLVAIDAFLDDVAGGLLGVLTADSDRFLGDVRDQLARQLSIDATWVAERLVAREAARAERDWAGADAIRDELLARHVVVMDTPEGTRWLIEPPAPETESESAGA